MRRKFHLVFSHVCDYGRQGEHQVALGGTECQCQTCVTTSSVMSSSSQDVNPQDYQDSPEYSGKQIESGDFRIFSSKRSFLLRKRMMEVSTNHLLLQMESNNFMLSFILKVTKRWLDLKYEGSRWPGLVMVSLSSRSHLVRSITWSDGQSEASIQVTWSPSTNQSITWSDGGDNTWEDKWFLREIGSSEHPSLEVYLQTDVYKDKYYLSWFYLNESGCNLAFWGNPWKDWDLVSVRCLNYCLVKRPISVA